MPDADRIGKLSRRWSKVYKEVCEGHFDSASLADAAMDPLRKDIEDYGDFPVHFLKDASNRLEELRNNPLFLPVHDWSEEDRFIRDLKFSYMQKSRFNQRGIDLAISAYKEVVYNFRNGQIVDGNLNEVLICKYIRRIYDGNFTDLVPRMLGNQVNPDWEGISDRLHEMDVLINEKIDSIAPQIARKDSVKRLRIRSRSIFQKIISITDDVFSLGNNR